MGVLIHTAVERMKSGTKFITGHVPFHRSYTKYDYDFMTVLRDPYERMKSSLIYRKLGGRNFDPDGTSHNFNPDPDEFFRYLNSPRFEIEAHHYTIFFGDGAYDFKTPEWEELLTKAMENMQKFKIIGLLEQPAYFLKAFKAEYGISLNIPQKNVSRQKNQQLYNECEALFKAPGTKDLLMHNLRHDTSIYHEIKKAQGHSLHPHP
jgi:hypothetical protein